jgi:hypothetical protein
MTLGSASTISVTPPPSRSDNPFATCWTKPGALPYRFAAGESAEKLVGRLGERWWRGAIVGPHGSGKSTLLETLKPAIAAAGRHVVQISLHDGQRRLPGSVWRELEAVSRDLPQAPRREQPLVILIIDGYEQLSLLQRWLVGGPCGRRCYGLIVTAHTPVHFPVHIPTLVQTAPTGPVISQLVADLTAEVSTQVTPEDIAASHACHGSNVREVFFDLYDRHEKLRRAP